MKNINVSIVLFKNDKNLVKKTIYSCINSFLINKLYLIDNSPTDALRCLVNLDDRIIYIYNNANLGYGRAHNIAIKKSIDENTPYHLILNPDVYFNRGVLEELYKFMEMNKDVGLVIPKVLYSDGTDP